VIAETAGACWLVAVVVLRVLPWFRRHAYKFKVIARRATFVGLVALSFMAAPLAVDAPRAAPKDASGTILDSTAREVEWFKTHCAALSDMYIPEVTRTCRVNSFGAVGVVSGRRVYFALYRRLVILPGDGREPGSEYLQAGSIVDRPPFDNTAIVIFEETPEATRIRPILADVNEGYLGSEWFVEPWVIERNGQQLLVISRHVYRAPEEERSYAFENGAWVPMERPQ
jgi:hypothetical protein